MTIVDYVNLPGQQSKCFPNFWSAGSTAIDLKIIPVIKFQLKSYNDKPTIRTHFSQECLASETILLD